MEKLAFNLGQHHACNYPQNISLLAISVDNMGQSTELSSTQPMEKLAFNLGQHHAITLRTSVCWRSVLTAWGRAPNSAASPARLPGGTEIREDHLLRGFLGREGVRCM